MGSKKKQVSGLTAKQEAFCQAYVKGATKGNASASYRTAYTTENMKDSSIRAEACRLLDNLNITQRIDQLNADIVHQNRLMGVSLRQRVQEGLLSEALTAESPSARVRAWELVGKLDGVDAFGADRVETSTKISTSEAEADLQEAISAALSDQNVVHLFDK